MTPLVLCALLMIEAVIGMKPIGRALQRRWPGADEPAELTAAEEARLQAIADVPLVDIIEAAERRASHPDEPLPKILADLDPETRVQDVTPSEAPKAGVPYVPVAPSLAAARLRTMSLGGFLNEHGKPRPGKGVMVLPAGMDCQVVSVTPPTPKRNPAPDPYANCTHPEADRVEVCSADSAAPVKTFVTECPRCEERTAEGSASDYLVAGYIECSELRMSFAPSEREHP